MKFQRELEWIEDNTDLVVAETIARLSAGVAQLEAENEQMLEFCIMLRESISGGGRVVTFQDIDIEFLEALGGE